ncbi:MAG TPA: PepSY-associated TM helix domain-containing protein [Gemmata sp.]|jgi:uncharacterized iron-regulated membrane protein|nr:PepSY-associated TM helix domain-containing protein [Gemmata sp.]
MSQIGWRKWHRWIGFAAMPFLLFAAMTGVVAGSVEMLSEDEEAREKARERESDVKLPPAAEKWSEPMAKAFAGAGERARGAPIDRVTLDFKTEPPCVTIYLGKPGGGEDKKLVFNASSGEFLREEVYVDKPFLVRLHSGEAFGDWGQVLGLMWGMALIAIIVSGIIIYFAMRKSGRKGLGRLFW